MKNSHKHFAVFRTDRLGEVLLSTVAIDAIKKVYPRSDISFITSGYSRDIIEGRDDVREVLTVDTSSKKRWIHKAFQLAAVLRKKDIDVAVVLNPNKILHLACFVARIPVRLGYSRKWGFLLNKTLLDERDIGDKHEIEYTMDLLSVIGINVPASGPRLPVDKDAMKRTDEFLEKEGVGAGEGLIVIHPLSSNPSKVWDENNFTELLTKIRKKTDVPVVLIGEPGERSRADEIIEVAGGGALNLAGLVDIKGLICVLSKAVLFIGNDAGPMHMASALGIPIVAIFGRNILGVSPKRWGPWGKDNVVFHEADCEKCYDGDCPNERKCLKDVTVDMVYGAVRKILDSGKK